MNRPSPGTLAEISKVEPAAFEAFPMLHLFGCDTHEKMLALVTLAMNHGVIHPGFGGDALPKKQPIPPGEPDALLLAYPANMRHGLLCCLIAGKDAYELDGASIYFSEAPIHRFRIAAISLSEARTQAILHGTLAGGIAVSMYEPTFISDRQWHGRGADHDVMVYGLAHQYKIGTFNGATALSSIKGPMPDLYHVEGQVVRVRAYDLPVLEQSVSVVTVTIARLNNDQTIADPSDINIDVYITDLIRAGQDLPRVGDRLEATIRLCCRLWMANPFRL